MTNETNEKPSVLAVDGDIVAYRTAAVCEDHFEGSCNDILDTTLKTISTDTGISNMRIYISGRTNFRYDVATTKPYKGNRATMVRPQYLNHCKQYLIDNYKAIVMHGYEADDGIATDMTINGAAHCGIDKDILQIAGWHYNYVKEEWQHVTPEEAEITLYRQVLMGDTSDNIPGLPRIGEVKAANAITDHETAATDAVKYYEEVCKEKLPDIDFFEYFVEQLKLIKMITNVDVYKMITTKVDPETEGFEVQEGNFEGEELRSIRL